MMISQNLIPVAIVSAAVGPALLLLWFVVAADSRSKSPINVLNAVVRGVLCCIVAAGLEALLERLIPSCENVWCASGQTALLFAAIPEETLKVLAIGAIALRVRDFDEPMDGVVYGAAVGLGFAALENFLYLKTVDAEWATMALLRAMLTVPLHGALGVIAGAYIAGARFCGALGGDSHDKGRRWRLLFLAWLVPVVLHTIFDYLTFSTLNMDADTDGGADAIAVTLLMLIIAGFGTTVIAVRLTRRIAARQKAWIEARRLPFANWRGTWAQCIASAGLCFIGLALIVAGNTIVKITGGTIVTIAVWYSWKFGQQLTEKAKQFDRRILNH